MRASAIRTRLRANVDVVVGLTRDVGEIQAAWKPAPDQWSILEVINHLADEEVEDFRARLALTLSDPASVWPPIDPPGWVAERGYASRPLAESVDRFVRARAESLTWLESLGDVDWGRAHDHARLGSIRAGDLLTSWLAHDLIHVRQLDRLHRQYLDSVLSPYSSDYAGPW